MNELINIQKKIIPEALVLLERRYSILKEIYMTGVIGRRMLATRLDFPERTVRSEVEFLKNEGLISIQAAGMEITELGIQLIQGLKEYISEIKGLSDMQDLLKDKLGIKKVIIAATSMASNPNALKELGKEASREFLATVSHHAIVGVTGGYTVHAFAQQIPKRDFENMMIVPARGGVGEVLEIQSNAIVAQLANQLRAKYKLLQIPDNLDQNLMESITNDPQIKGTYDYIKKIDFLVFGIGKAEEMSARRHTPLEKWNELRNSGAVSESFGYYFDIQGKIVHETGTVGIKLDQYKQLSHVIGIAGGKNKADAILSISKINKNLVLVTDEDAAMAILEKLHNIVNL